MDKHEREEAVAAASVEAARVAVARAAITTHIRQRKRKHLHLKKTQSTYTDPLQKGLTDLGLGLVYNPNLITELRLAGGIYEDNGKLKWANGWNANNYRGKLN